MCDNNLNLVAQVCDNLSSGNFSEEQKEVQKIAANVDMYSDLMKQVFAQNLVSLSVTSFQGSADDLCTISWTVERQSGSKISHSFPFLWKLPHMPWLHRQHLLL